MNRPEYLQKLIIKKTSYRWKETQMTDFSPCRFDDIEQGLLQQKHSTSIHSWSNQFWNPIANFSVKMEHNRTSFSNLTHR